MRSYKRDTDTDTCTDFSFAGKVLEKLFRSLSSNEIGFQFQNNLLFLAFLSKNFVAACLCELENQKFSPDKMILKRDLLIDSKMLYKTLCLIHHLLGFVAYQRFQNVIKFFFPELNLAEIILFICQTRQAYRVQNVRKILNNLYLDI